MFCNLPILFIDISTYELGRKMQLMRVVEQIGRNGKGFKRFIAIVRVLLGGWAVKTWRPTTKEKQ